MEKSFKMVYSFSALIVLISCSQPEQIGNSSQQLKDVVEQQGQIKLDQVNQESILIGKIKIGTTKEELEKELGEPDSIEEMFNDFEGYKFFGYQYKKSTFYLSDGSVEGFQILDNMPLSINGKILEVGNSIRLLKELFPSSFENRIQGDDKSSSTVRIVLNGEDEFLLIGVDDEKVTSFGTWTRY